MQEELIKRAKELLADGTVARSAWLESRAICLIIRNHLILKTKTS